MTLYVDVAKVRAEFDEIEAQLVISVKAGALTPELLRMGFALAYHAVVCATEPVVTLDSATAMLDRALEKARS